jgi:hypothetical protein
MPRAKSKPTRRAPVRKAAPELAGRQGLPEENSSGDRLCWRFRHVDHDGPWGFGKVSTETFCEILKKLASFESMTANEAFGGSPGKDYEVVEIPNREAIQRLEVLGLGDQTRISRFELQGKWRLYGFRSGNVFHVVWWDPKHAIWPLSRNR